MITILHNPRCSKSREGLSILERSGKDFKVIKYLDDPISIDTLKHIISLLGIAPIELIRKNEAIWKSKFKNMTLSDDDIINAMIENPKLIERPIVKNGNKAVVGRPTERIQEIV